MMQTDQHRQKVYGNVGIAYLLRSLSFHLHLDLRRGHLRIIGEKEGGRGERFILESSCENGRDKAQAFMPFNLEKLRGRSQGGVIIPFVENS